nr:hypothetical transcript [Hymenolepis microstoma]
MVERNVRREEGPICQSTLVRVNREAESFTKSGEQDSSAWHHAEVTGDVTMGLTCESVVTEVSLLASSFISSANVTPIATTSVLLHIASAGFLPPPLPICPHHRHYHYEACVSSPNLSSNTIHEIWVPIRQLQLSENRQVQLLQETISLNRTIFVALVTSCCSYPSAYLPVTRRFLNLPSSLPPTSQSSPDAASDVATASRSWVITQEELLKSMLQHWSWLTVNECKALKDVSTADLSHNPSSAPQSTTIKETEIYVKQFRESEPSFHDLSSSIMVSRQDSLKITNNLKGMFERAGYQVSARNSPENSSIGKHEEKQDEESLLDIVMRSLPHNVDELDGKPKGSNNSQTV